jgi:hypothetical protein
MRRNPQEEKMNSAVKDEIAKVKVEVPVSEQDVKDLLECAFYSGVDYWASVAKVVDPNERHYTCEIPLDPEGEVHIAEDDVNGEPYKMHILNREKVIQGLHIMAEKYPRHFGDFINENADAITGDVFLQCCLLGEIVYG